MLIEQLRNEEHFTNQGSYCVLQDLSTQYCKEKVHTFAPEIFL